MPTRDIAICEIVLLAVFGWCLWSAWKRIREYYRNKPPLRDVPPE